MIFIYLKKLKKTHTQKKIRKKYKVIKKNEIL